MIRGLQITIRGSELSDRIAERIRMHEVTISALDARIDQRAGDQVFDVRAEDGFKTLGELETERLQYRDRVCCLTLLRDNVAREEIYALDKRDLRLAELISTDLAFAELLPAKPGWLEQDEYEERNRVGFQLERLTKEVGALTPSVFALTSAAEQGQSGK